MEIKLVLFLREANSTVAVPVDELRLNGDLHSNADIHRHLTTWLQTELDERFPLESDEEDEDGLEEEPEDDDLEEDW